MSQKNYNIYLDNAASMFDRSKIVYKSAWSGNSHSIHRVGRRASVDIVFAERILKDAINGWEGEFLYVGSGSQANSLFLQTMAPTGSFLTTAMEHKSILQHVTNKTCILQPNRWGFVNNIHEDSWCAEHAASFQLVNNEIGTVQPVRSLIDDLPAGIPVHVDAVQAFGKISIDVEELEAEALTLSSHKVGGPKGLGLLWVRNTILDEFPYQGTEPTELISRLAGVVKDTVENLQIYADHTAVLENQFYRSLLETGVHFKLNASQHIAGILSLQFLGIDADDLLFALDEQGIYVSNGSACSSGDLQPSHVLTAIGLSDQAALSTIRVSICHNNTMADVEIAGTAMGNIAKELQNGS